MLNLKGELLMEDDTMIVTSYNTYEDIIHDMMEIDNTLNKDKTERLFLEKTINGNLNVVHEDNRYFVTELINLET